MLYLDKLHQFLCAVFGLPFFLLTVLFYSRLLGKELLLISLY